MFEDTFHSRFEDRSRFRPIVAAGLVVSVCLLAACTPPSFVDLLKTAGEPFAGVAGTVEAESTTKRLPSISGDPLLAFLAEAENGAVRDFEDAEAGTRLRVTAGRIYQAASGRICRRFSATGVSSDEADEEGLVCRSAAGRWVRVGMLVPVAH